MKICVDKLLNERNKTRYWLSVKTGATYPNVCNLASNKTSSLKFDLLEKICIALNCTPNDILEIEK